MAGEGVDHFQHAHCTLPKIVAKVAPPLQLAMFCTQGGGGREYSGFQVKGMIEGTIFWGNDLAIIKKKLFLNELIRNKFRLTKSIIFDNV